MTFASDVKNLLNDLQIDEGNGGLQTQVDKLKSNLDQLTEKSIQESSVEIENTISLKDRLTSYIRNPAFIVLLNAIVKSNSTTIDELAGFGKHYTLPNDWDKGGLNTLVNDGLIVRVRDNISITSGLEGN